MNKITKLELVVKERRRIRSNTARKKKKEQVVREMSYIFDPEEDIETKKEFESKLVDLITSESNKEVIIAVEKDKKHSMDKQFCIGKYEQINPNWSAFFACVRDHDTITEKY